MMSYGINTSFSRSR